jgi:hypothetical protein
MRFATPRFVPVEELLREVEHESPLTPEGWIVQKRSAASYFQETDADRLADELVEHPMKMRNYDSQIRMLRAQLDSLQRRLANYHYFNKAGALFVTVEQTQLAILAVQEELRNLRHERMLVRRLHHIERARGDSIRSE